MAKYRKKPVVIEAEQWFPDRRVDGVVSAPLIDGKGGLCGCVLLGGLTEAHVHTLEGPLLVSPGDWIITGVKGEKYLCKPDIFAATYEPV
jgi:hypothetical protein